MTVTCRVVSPKWLWSFPPVYLIHLVDERFFREGTAAWATAHMGVHLTNEAWFVINAVWLVGLILVTWLTARGSLPQWVVVVLATHLAIHSFTRIWGSVVFPGLSPGVVSGVLLGAPWALYTLGRGLRALPRREFALGVVVGVLSVQPVWDFLMLPILSPHPAA